MIQEIASEMNKSKRQIFHKSTLLTKITEVIVQMTSYTIMFKDGSHRLIHGKITILPVNRDTRERHRGLLEVAFFRNGNRPDQDFFYGFMGSVSPPTTTLSQGRLMNFTPDSGSRKEHSLVR